MTVGFSQNGKKVLNRSRNSGSTDLLVLHFIVSCSAVLIVKPNSNTSTFFYQEMPFAKCRWFTMPTHHNTATYESLESNSYSNEWMNEWIEAKIRILYMWTMANRYLFLVEHNLVIDSCKWPNDSDQIHWTYAKFSIFSSFLVWLLHTFERQWRKRHHSSLKMVAESQISHQRTRSPDFFSSVCVTLNQIAITGVSHCTQIRLFECIWGNATKTRFSLALSLVNTCFRFGLLPFFFSFLSFFSSYSNT